MIANKGIIQLFHFHFDFEFPAIRHCFTGIHDEVHQYLFQLPRIHPNRAEFRVSNFHQSDILRDQALKYGIHIIQQRAEIEHFRFNDLLPTERQEFTGQISGMMSGLLNGG